MMTKRRNTIFDWMEGEELGHVEFNGRTFEVWPVYPNMNKMRGRWRKVLNDGWVTRGRNWYNDYCYAPIIKYYDE